VWHNPRALNAAAGLLCGLALCLFAFAALRLLTRPAVFPLRELVVHGTLKHTSRAQIESTARGLRGRNFLAVDLAALRVQFEQLPWVRRVTVRRVWPDRLEIDIEEHIALAKWLDGGGVNLFGERFPGTVDGSLPVFEGPPGSEPEVTRRYRLFAARLAPLGMEIVRVGLSPRFAWQLRVAGGLRIQLGRDAPNDPAEARLARFAAVYPQTVQRLAGQHDYVDLRYTNGFALRVPDLERDAKSPPRRRG